MLPKLTSYVSQSTVTLRIGNILATVTFLPYYSGIGNCVFNRPLPDITLSGDFGPPENSLRFHASENGDRSFRRTREFYNLLHSLKLANG